MTASKQSQDGTSWLCLEAVIKNLHEAYQCHPDSVWKRSSKTCMKLTNAILTLFGSGHQKPAWNLPMPSWLCLEAIIKNLHETYHCHPDSVWKRSSKTCMKLTSAECTVENSEWRVEKMPEICRILWQNKLGKLMHLFGYLKRILNLEQIVSNNAIYI